VSEQSETAAAMTAEIRRKADRNETKGGWEALSGGVGGCSTLPNNGPYLAGKPISGTSALQGSRVWLLKEQALDGTMSEYVGLARANQN
jgi:hypothetical protein